MKIGIIKGDMSLGGGGERVATTLANYFAKNGHDVTLYYYSEGMKFDLDKKVRAIHIGQNNTNWFGRKIYRIIGIRKYLKHDDLDALITLGWADSIYGAVFCPKNALFIASERNDPYSEPDFFLFRGLVKWAYHRSDVLVCQTDRAKEYFPNENTVVILNPLRPDLPVKYDGTRTKTIVNYCRFTEQKNLPLLIKAFSIFVKSHKDYCLKIYGEGPLKEQLNQMVCDLNLHDKAEILPFSTNIHETVRTASMYVSSSNYEGLSNSMLEAMAIGMPVICTDCPIGGARMVINNGENGILVPVNNEYELAKAMNKMADNPVFATNCGNKAYMLRDKLSEYNICKCWEKLICENLKK